MEKNEVKDRIEEIDILKSIGIILMIMGHIGFGKTFDFYIHAFHMPMFYIISGFLYKKSNKSLKKFLIKKVKTLLVPYYVFAIIHYVAWTIINIGLKKEVVLINPLLHILCFNTDGMPISGALWFLTSLFFVDIMYYFIDYIKNSWIKLITIIIITISGCIIPQFFRLPLALDTAFMGIGLYTIGHLLRSINKEKNYIIASILLISGSTLCFINGYINVRMGIYSNIIIYFIVAICMTGGLYIICTKLKSFHWHIIREAKFIGKNSLVYLCLNQIIILFLNKVLLFDVNNILIIVIIKVIILLITLFILHALVLILNKDKFKWIIGK